MHLKIESEDIKQIINIVNDFTTMDGRQVDKIHGVVSLDNKDMDEQDIHDILCCFGDQFKAIDPELQFELVT